MRHVDRRAVLAISAVIAIGGFLALHDYKPGYGFVWNVMHGEINLTTACSNAAPSLANEVQHSGSATAPFDPFEKLERQYGNRRSEAISTAETSMCGYA